MTTITTLTGALRKDAYDSTVGKLTTMESAIRTTLGNHTKGDAEMTQQEALALQFKIQGYNIVVSTMSTISKDLSDMIKGILAKF